MTAAIGADRLGVRLSPFGQYGGIHDSDPLELFIFVIGELSRRRIAYLHLIEARGSEIGLTDELNEGALNNAALFRPPSMGRLCRQRLTRRRARRRRCAQRYADAIAFGRAVHRQPRSARTHPGERRPARIRPHHRLWRRSAWLHGLSVLGP